MVFPKMFPAYGNNLGYIFIPFQTWIFLLNLCDRLFVSTDVPNSSYIYGTINIGS